MFEPAQNKSKKLSNGYYWSSSEYLSLGAHYMNTDNGYVYNYYKTGTFYFRPFIKLKEYV